MDSGEEVEEENNIIIGDHDDEYIEQIGNDTFFWRLVTKICCFDIRSVKMKYIVLLCVTFTFIYMFFLLILFWSVTGKARYPALSETGAYIPGRYFFTFFFSIMGTGVVLIAVFLYTSQKSVISYLNKRKRKTYKCCLLINLHFCNFISWFMMGVAGIGLCILGVFPLFEDATPGKLGKARIQMIHLTGAFIFFSFILGHMIVQTCVLFHYNFKRQVWNFVKVLVIGCFFYFWLGQPMLYWVSLMIICDIEDLNSYIDQSYKWGSCGYLDYTINWVSGLTQSCVIWTALIWGFTLYFESSFMTLNLRFLEDQAEKFVKEIEEMGAQDEELLDNFIGMGGENNREEEQEEANNNKAHFVPLVDEEEDDDDDDDNVNNSIVEQSQENEEEEEKEKKIDEDEDDGEN